MAEPPSARRSAEAPCDERSDGEFAEERSREGAASLFWSGEGATFDGWAISGGKFADTSSLGACATKVPPAPRSIVRQGGFTANHTASTAATPRAGVSH